MADEILSSVSCSRSLQQDHKLEAKVFSICARAGASCIGIQRGFGIAPDSVLFQPVGTTLAVPLAEFADPARAIALIKAKLVQVQR